MNREQKAAVVEEIAGQIKSADAIFAVDYRGISVSQAADLRAKLRESGTKFRIVKNSLSERAADKAGAQELKSMLEGPTALALVSGDAALAAKALNDTARTLHILEFKGGFLDGATLTADEVRSIARLPARDVLHAQLVGTIAAPLTGLVRGLNALIAGSRSSCRRSPTRGSSAARRLRRRPPKRRRSPRRLLSRRPRRRRSRRLSRLPSRSLRRLPRPSLKPRRRGARA